MVRVRPNLINRVHSRRRAQSGSRHRWAHKKVSNRKAPAPRANRANSAKNSKADAEHKDEGEKQEAPGGKMSTEQGEQGAGNNPGENEGSMDTDTVASRGTRDDKGSPESELNDEEAPGQVQRPTRESDSKAARVAINRVAGKKVPANKPTPKALARLARTQPPTMVLAKPPSKVRERIHLRRASKANPTSRLANRARTNPAKAPSNPINPAARNRVANNKVKVVNRRDSLANSKAKPVKDPTDQQGQPSQNNSPSTGTAASSHQWEWHGQQKLRPATSR